MIQVHDELDISIEDETQMKKVISIMEECVQLEVPSVVDTEIGPNWGECVEN